jgi:hypothetical protein
VEITGSEFCAGMFIVPVLEVRARKVSMSRFLPLRGTTGIGGFVLSLSINICRIKRQENASLPELWKLQRALTPKEVKAAGREIVVFGARGFP